MATTWNPSDKSSNIVLTNGNLTAGASTTAIGAVRATVSHVTRKYYFETTCTFTASPGSFSIVGLTPSTTDLASGFWNVQTGFGVFFINGNIYSNNSYTAKTLGAFANGDIACVAIDFDRQLIWFRKNNGDWNNDASADPAAGTGGIDTSALFGTSLYPIYESGGSTTITATADFGASAFTYPPPSGFNSWDTTPTTAVDLDQQYVEVISTGDPTDQKVRLDQQFVEVISTGDPPDQKVRLDQQYLEVISTGDASNQSVRLDQIYIEVIASLDQALQPSAATDTDSFYVPDVQGASGSQTLTPTLFADTDATYAPTLSAGAITLQPNTVVDTDATYAPSIEAYQSITPILFNDGDVFISPSVLSTATLSPSAFDDVNTFYVPSVGTYWQTAPLRVTDNDTTYQPSVLSTAELLPSAMQDVDTVRATTALAVNYLRPDAVQDADAVPQPDVKRGPLTLEPDTVLFGTAFFSPTVFIQLHVNPPLLFDGDRFPFPTSTALYVASPSTFDADDIIYLPTITTGPIAIYPPFLVDTDVEYVPAVQRQSKGGGNGGGGSGGTVTTNLKYASRFTMDTSGLVTTLEAQVNASQVVNTRMMIYADNAGLPGALLGQTATKSSVTAGANDYALIVPVSLLAGQAFWVALHSDGNFNWFLTNQKGGSRYNTDLFSDGPSDPFGSSSIDNKKAPVFVVYLDAVNATVSPGTVQADDVTFSPHVTGAKALLPPFLADQDFTYGSATHYSITLLDTDREPSGDQVYAPTLTIGAVTLLPDLLDDTDTLRSANIGRGPGYVFPTPFVDNDIVREPYVEQRGAVLSVDLFNDADAVYSPTAYDVVTVAENAFNADDVVFGPVVSRGDVTIAPPLLHDSSENIFDPIVVRHGGVFAVTPPLFIDADDFIGGLVGYPPMSHHEALRGDRTQPSLGGLRDEQRSLTGQRDDVSLRGERDSVSLRGERDNEINLEGER